MKTILIIPFMVLCVLLSAEEDPGLNYIALYKNMAVGEMHRTGIPASIKLAQGMLESASGRSILATEANNHFGIKCGGSWEGETYYREDDDHDANGKLIKSCFRSFRDATESYLAHSAFLTDQKRYAFLFQYSKDDYISWAKGLRKAGYATDKAYPDKLINLIEKYELYKYDLRDEEAMASKEMEFENIPSPVVVEENNPATTASTSAIPAQSNRKKRHRSPQKQKAVKSNSEKVFHIVQEGQTMSEIAMLNDMEETLMRLRNRIPKDAEPLPGEKIFLRKKISIFKRPEFTRNPAAGTIVSEEEYIF